MEYISVRINDETENTDTKLRGDNENSALNIKFDD